MPRYDAVLLASFGGPESAEDVEPFLQAVTAGRDIPPERLAEVAEQYQAVGGKSPINDQNRELRAALEAALNEGADGSNARRVYWGNRNWAPYFADALRQMRDDGVTHAACVITSGYSSYSGCRQYRENLFDAVADVEADGLGPAPTLDRIRRWFDQPEFIEVMVENTVNAVTQLSTDSVPRLIFTTHSLPISMASESGDPDFGGNGYVRQHEFVAERVAQAVSSRLGCAHDWELVYQSRSGPPQMPWLEPDVNDHLRVLRSQGVKSAVVIPIGFVSDHMEVKWDLDTVAAATADSVGIDFQRASTVGIDPRFVNALVRMVREREEGVPIEEQVSCSPWGAAPARCAVGCCPNPRKPRPALFGQGGLND